MQNTPKINIPCVESAKIAEDEMKNSQGKFSYFASRLLIVFVLFLTGLGFSLPQKFPSSY